MDEKDEAIKELKRLFELGGYKVYTKLEHVSRSGMLRHISAFVIVDNTPIHINHLIAKLGHYKRVPYGKRSEGVILHGCGSDMGFELVYNTSGAVYGFGNSEEIHNIAVKLARTRNGVIENSGAYLLRQEWV